MERSEIIRLLPCYRMGQLEADEADAVRRALHEDPSLRQLLTTIQDAERLCAATLHQGAPARLRSLAPASEPPRLLGAGWSWLAGLITIAALGILVLVGRGPDPAAGRLEPLEDLFIAARIGAEDLIPATTPEALHQALLRAGVPSELALVNDLRSLGLTLEGAVRDSQRVAIVWHDKTGGMLLCVIGPRLGIHRVPDEVLRPDTGDGPVLQGHQLHGFSVVYWEKGGLGYALVAGASLAELAALAFRAVWRPVG